MIACVDVDYDDDKARAAGVVFAGWEDEAPTHTCIKVVSPIEPYEAGSFYKRELPCVLAVLNRVNANLDTIVIDGYVWLDDAGRRGLGAHLFERLGEGTTVVGVAKNAFGDASFAKEVYRGQSRRPLYVTAAGIDANVAARHVEQMHGNHRIPTLCALADRLCRSGDGRT